MVPAGRAVYGADFFSDRSSSDRSARVVVPDILSMVRPTSVLDVGCGDGSWLRAFMAAGVEILGVDGAWAAESLVIPYEFFMPADLSEPVEIEGRFDLALSLEVAEHLPENVAPSFVATLTRAAPIVLFSAAVPGQAGVNHVNEQWPEYWAALFAHHGFVAVDSLRRHYWPDDRVAHYYAQNMMFYVDRDQLEYLPSLELPRPAAERSPLALVHPALLGGAVRRAERKARRAEREARRAESLRVKAARRAIRSDERLRAKKKDLARMQESRWWRLGQRMKSLRP